MRVLLLTISILASSFATQLISTDGIEELFKKHVRNELSEEENQKFQDVLDILRRPEHVSMKSLESSSPTRSFLDCIICRGVFTAIFEGVGSGESDETLTEMVITFCTGLNIVTYNVCRGAVELNANIIIHIIRTTPEVTPYTFCGMIVQSSDNPNVCPMNDARFEWEVELPPPPVTPPTPPAVDTTPLKIVLITDAHIDPLYEENGVAECDEPTCCRVGQRPAQSYSYKEDIDESIIEQSLMDLNDEHMLDLSIAPTLREMRSSKQSRFAPTRNAPPAGYWGDYRNCDSPLRVYDNVIETIAENHKDIDAIYYIGDTIDHGVWETTYELINDMNRHIIEKIREQFGDEVMVVPVIGNHESQPTNQFAPATITGEKLNTTWLYDALAEKWGYYLTEEAKATLRRQGDFSILLRPGLRVISINNNIPYVMNWWVAYDPTESKRHLEWLIEELYKAEAAGEKVHILGHIPPGVHDFIVSWTRQYNRIVNRFSSTIAAEFSGHTHADEFKIFYDPEGNPINIAWGAGSTTSYTFYNVNYKIADINPATYEPTNIENYVFNLTEANLTPERKPHWFQLYDLKNTFRLNDLSPTTMNNLITDMVTTKRDLLDVYSAFTSRISDRWWWCNNDCKINHICRIVVTVLWERQRCEELRQLFYST